MANHLPKRVGSDFEVRYPQASAKSTECAMNLVYTTDLMVKRISGLIQHLDITPASGLVLSILADTELPLPPNKIAEQLIISRATVTGLIDSLERRAYVRRLRHPTDRRMLLVELTGSGRQVANEFRPIVHQHQKLWLEVLSSKEQDLLLDMLSRLQATLIEPDDENPAN